MKCSSCLLLSISPCSFNVELSTFLKPLSYSSLGALSSSTDGVSMKLGEEVLRTTTHTKTGNNTVSFGTRTNNTTTHTKLKITLEASELESITQQLTQNWE
jgi:hypothetical protein